jgi:methyltransferase
MRSCLSLGALRLHFANVGAEAEIRLERRRRRARHIQTDSTVYSYRGGAVLDALGCRARKRLGYVGLADFLSSKVYADKPSAITAEQHMISPSRIARALAVFNVDEVVVYDDTPESSRAQRIDPRSYTGDIDHCHFMAHVLSYLEAPPFMRKTLFPLHPNLRFAAQTQSLDMPHHPHPNEWIAYREGVTLEGRRGAKGTLVDVGLKEPVTIEAAIPPKTRVTLHFPPESRTEAEPIHPTAPRTEGGYYWGYTVRRAGSLSAVFTESPYEDGYDVSVGTSERGKAVKKAFPPSKKLRFNHMIIVFGGPKGLEYASSNDEELVSSEASGARVRNLFDHWLNVLPGQGSRTIRTDEAVFIALSKLTTLWEDA